MEVFILLSLMRKYISEESAIEATVPTIIMIVVGIAIVVVIGILVFNAINSGKTQAENGLSDFDGLVNDINGLN